MVISWRGQEPGGATVGRLWSGKVLFIDVGAGYSGEASL